MFKKIKLAYNIQLIDYYVFLILSFTLPFGRNFFSPILFLWFILVLASYFVKKDFSFVKYKDPLFIPILFYLVFAISSLLTSELKVGLNELQFKLPLLLVPLLYPTQRESYRQGFNDIMKAYVIGCVVASLFLFGYATYRSFSLVNSVWVFNPIPQYGWNSYFLGTEFSYLIHPSYLSLLLLFALLIVGLFTERWWMKGVVVRITVLFSTLILIVSLIMLQSRTGFLGFCILFLTLLTYLIFSKRKYVLGLFILFVFIVSSIVFINKFHRYSETLESLKKTVNSGVKFDNSKEDGTIIRLWVWKSATYSIGQHPIWGVGAYNVKEYLNQEYIKRDMKSAVTVKLNAHNQFLETWLGMGIFGLITLLLMFIVPLWSGIKSSNWLLVGFSCLCGLGFMFESMLERILGIVFFIIFYTILVNCGIQKVKS